MNASKQADELKIKQSQLIQVFQDLKSCPDEGVCFLLGAGASHTSGIPTGGMLAKEWYAELKKSLGSGLAAWQQAIEGFDEARLAEFYPQIFEQRFKDHPTTGFKHLQDRMKDAEPSVGYSFLAQILANTQHKFVITTNFDHMVEDALRSYTDARPLVCGHESLAQYINARTERPTVIKVHRDLLLNPFNNTHNTGDLEAAWKLTLEPILQHYHLVVVGYGGNDGSLMNYLQGIQRRKGIYWCYRHLGEVNETVYNTLNQEYDRLVEIKGFDELMLALNSAFDYPMLVDRENLVNSRSVKIALEKAKRYKKQLAMFAEDEAKKGGADSENDATTREALLKLFGLNEENATDWWQIQFRINEESVSELKQELYEKGLQLLPNSVELRGNYALFLHEIRRDYEQAEANYRKALELDESHSNINSNYANFLHCIRKNYGQADVYYRKALDLDVSSASHNGNYAGFLLMQGKAAQALPHLEYALQSDRPDLLLECWFYRLAHFPEGREEARQQIEALLQQGIRSPGWDFSDNIRRAEQDGYPDVAELTALAARINEV